MDELLPTLRGSASSSVNNIYIFLGAAMQSSVHIICEDMISMQERDKVNYY